LLHARARATIESRAARAEPHDLSSNKSILMVARRLAASASNSLGCLLILIAIAGRAAGDDVALDQLDGDVTKALADWEVPGLALAIVKDDQVVLAKGFGVRKLGDDAKVDADTLFAIGSASKAFTAATLAILVDEGKLGWDDPANKHLPGLQLFDAAVTRELTVRDLLCHRCGLPRGDLLWYATPYSRDEILRRVRHLEPKWSLRSHFGYQNIMFLAAGEIVPKLTGTSWDDFVKQRLFLPLGMKSSGTSVRELAQQGNVATPHVKLEDKVEAVAWRNIDNVAPAGSINSSANDMAQWLRLQLGDGAIDGKRLISAEAMREMHSPQSIVEREDNFVWLYPEAHFMTYGLGWFMHDYAGRKIVEHGGAIDGMRSQVALVPEEKLGIVVLANRGGSVLPHVLMFKIVDLYLKQDKHDWSTEALARVRELEKQAADAKKKAADERARDTKPSLPLEGYAGKFTDELYGDIEVRKDGDHLVLQRAPGCFEAELEHWHYDTFRARYRDRVIEPQLVTFRLSAAGKVESLVVPELAEFSAVPAE
jgi:CubicO group peptidase (beta-lactamase class C family)